MVFIYEKDDLYYYIKKHVPLIVLENQETIKECRWYSLIRNTVISLIVFLLVLGIVLNMYCAFTIGFPVDIYIYRKGILPYLLLPFILAIFYQFIFMIWFNHKYVIITENNGRKILIDSAYKSLKVI